MMTSEAGRAQVQLLLRVARRYYLDGASQGEIAKELGYSRATVSRLLAQARRRQVVRIKVGHPLERAMELERQLVEAFGLADARVADVVAGGSVSTAVGRCAAQYLVDNCADNSIITVSNGRAVAAVVAELPIQHRRDTVIVQMIGALGHSGQIVDSPEICRRMAQAIGGTHRTLPVPLVVGSARMATALRREEAVATTLALGSHADMALVGVGATDRSGSGHIYTGWMTPGLARELDDAGAVGHICGHHFDSEGRLVKSSLAARTLTIDPDALHVIPRVLGVVWGPDKVRALLGAMRGRYLNVLITDEDTAVALLKDAESSRGTASGRRVR